MVYYGLEVFIKEELFKKYLGKRIALLCNQASVDAHFKPSFIWFKEIFGSHLKLLFSPQHGLFAEKQANMIGSEDEIEPFTHTPVVSLYGPRLSPEKKHLDEVEIIFVDLQEVGCRVYTYIWTLYLMMESCERWGKKVVILDRPNPIGRIIEGPLLESKYFSLIGMEELPLRYGLTIGELSLLFKKRKFPNLELEVIKMKGYRGGMFFKDTERSWVFSSPNIPFWEVALVYPGQVLLEGTNLSEGRGTTLPFLIFGAPFLQIKETFKVLQSLFPPEKTGCLLRPVVFEPTFSKWKNQRCYGFQIHLINPAQFQPVKFSLILIKFLKETYPEFRFLEPPYEFEKNLKPIEILIGNSAVLNWIEGKEEIDLDFYLYYNLKKYKEEIKEFYLYDN
ncbi:MAG: DUF1343 domain-containing protein [Thermodesulfobacteriaceae bacterium]|nr:DUF1343 domain-containing protein [Thermodesulfobacteriaceae bacterium]